MLLRKNTSIADGILPMRSLEKKKKQTNKSTHFGRGGGDGRDYVHAASRPQIPKSNGTILRAAREYHAAPIIQR